MFAVKFEDVFSPFRSADDEAPVLGLDEDVARPGFLDVVHQFGDGPALIGAKARVPVPGDSWLGWVGPGRGCSKTSSRGLSSPRRVAQGFCQPIELYQTPRRWQGCRQSRAVKQAFDLSIDYDRTKFSTKDVPKAAARREYNGKTPAYNVIVELPVPSVFSTDGGEGASRLKLGSRIPMRQSSRTRS